MTDDWKVLTALPHTAAVLLRGALQAEGIAAEVDRDALSVVYGLDSGGHATKVLVRGRELRRARKLLADLEAPV